MVTTCDQEIRNVYLANCPCRGLLDRVADKWTALVLGQLETGTKRFSELRRAIEGVSQKMLTQTLRNLERDGLVQRRVFPTVPVRVDYTLTALGETVIGPLAAIRAWAEQHLDEVTEAQERYDERVADGEAALAI